MKDIGSYKHIFFDLDDTLTSSRSRVDDDMAELLRTLPVDLVAVSGAEIKQIREQLGDLPFYHLGQNGNHALTPQGELIWERSLSDSEKHEIFNHVSRVLAVAEWDISDVNDLIEDRGSQIGYSLIGHHENKDRKRSFDPTSEKRFEILRRIPFASDIVEVKVGGTTCLDYFKKGHHKGSNVRTLIEYNGWNAENCIYFGDKLMPGGNDETVIGIIDTCEVKDHRDTYKKLRDSFALKKKALEEKIALAFR